MRLFMLFTRWLRLGMEAHCLSHPVDGIVKPNRAAMRGKRVCGDDGETRSKDAPDSDIFMEVGMRGEVTDYE